MTKFDEHHSSIVSERARGCFTVLQQLKIIVHCGQMMGKYSASESMVVLADSTRKTYPQLNSCFYASLRCSGDGPISMDTAVTQKPQNILIAYDFTR